ncbi:MAG: hypothetical protein JST00_07620 [Deltaproteobacteria bacterium]|nr:hypothetical protein [Deltaproteobacteria bacterium]
MATATPALAQENSIAEQLFLEGRALMKAERYAEACPKLRAAFDLDKTATGTLLNLALCHEKVGMLASAWAEFRQVEAEAAGRREDRVAIAREHQAALFPRLARVRLLVPIDIRIPGLELALDDRPVSGASWGSDLPIDAGHHTLRANAPGRLPAMTTFDIVDGDLREVVVPMLAIEPVKAPAEATAPSGGRTARRIGGIALGATGLVATGVGLAFGLRASSSNSEAERLCPDRLCASEVDRRTATESRDSARGSANVANVFVIAGGACIAAGLVLVLTALPTSPPKNEGAAHRERSVRFGGGPSALGGGAIWLEGSL